jgi:hypothetical protein
MDLTRFAIQALVLAALIVAAPLEGAAQSPVAVLYEVVEELKQDDAKRVVDVSMLVGKTPLGTPPCPDSLADLMPAGATSCNVVIHGWDSVDSVTGLGTFGGKFTIMVQGDNPFDGNELVALTGSFQGHMDSSPVRTTGHPFGTVTGKLTVDNRGDFPITGVFRMPFAGSYRPDPTGPTLREWLCPKTPTAKSGPDYVYVDTTDGQPNGSCIDVRSEERLLGVPMVRFEISFPETPDP